MEKEKVPLKDDYDFEKIRKYLESELKDMHEGKAPFIEMEEVERRLTSTIKKRGDRIQR